MRGNLNDFHSKPISLRQARIMRLLHEDVPILILVFMVTSCATRPIAVSSIPTYDTVLPAFSEILVLQPLLKFEQLHDETVIDPSKFDGPTLISSLDTSSKNAVAKSKFRVAVNENLNSSECGELCSRLGLLSSRLSIGQINDEAKTMLQQLSSIDPDLAILSLYLHVKVGPGGYWNPNSGAIRSSMSSSHFQICLIHCGTGQVLWKNEVLLRKIPKVDDSKYAESLRLLYTNFPGKKEE